MQELTKQLWQLNRAPKEPRPSVEGFYENPTTVDESQASVVWYQLSPCILPLLGPVLLKDSWFNQQSWEYRFYGI